MSFTLNWILLKEKKITVFLKIPILKRYLSSSSLLFASLNSNSRNHYLPKATKKKSEMRSFMGQDQGWDQPFVGLDYAIVILDLFTIWSGPFGWYKAYYH